MYKRRRMALVDADGEPLVNRLLVYVGRHFLDIKRIPGKNSFSLHASEKVA